VTASTQLSQSFDSDMEDAMTPSSCNAHRTAGRMIAGMAVALSALLSSAPASAAGTDVQVLCGSSSTTIKTGRALDKARVIRVSVDPANQCKVEVSIELRGGARGDRGSQAGLSAPAKSDARCFLLAGKSYCE
jgi:hypothetical protein